VADCERHIAREEQVVSELDRASHDTEQARARLRRFNECIPRNLLPKML
jgi:hypothetical protein